MCSFIHLFTQTQYKFRSHKVTVSCLLSGERVIECVRRLLSCSCRTPGAEVRQVRAYLTWRVGSCLRTSPEA
ncbi:hypothetical protein E2C01_096421 [Portunus trituberculatus]|uniref:Uncharacterized protein n=1 Tax=Portunus trituberculatus TaxID=210409 RepID=A0A5B7K1Z3_PORTR|nr:hypothetical protein [Portunus trituberculatus]